MFALASFIITSQRFSFEGQRREGDRWRQGHVSVTWSPETPPPLLLLLLLQVSMMAASNYYGFTHAAAAAGPQYRYKTNTQTHTKSHEHTSYLQQSQSHDGYLNEMLTTSALISHRLLLLCVYRCLHAVLISWKVKYACASINTALMHSQYHVNKHLVLCF